MNVATQKLTLPVASEDVDGGKRFGVELEAALLSAQIDFRPRLDSGKVNFLRLLR